MVLAARDGGDSSGGEAMESLCRAYWYPLYAFVRRSGRSPEDSQDLTQAFFARLLEKDFLRLIAPEKGRFRSFLLVAFKRFLAQEWHKSRALKRGGGAVVLPVDPVEAERRYAVEVVDEVSPEVLYDRRWALTLLERTLARLKDSYDSTGRGLLYDQFKDLLIASTREESFAEMARAANLSENAARVAVHRMRRRFRNFFREELAETVTPDKLEEELQDLRKILSA
ncbi:sigma factor [soil metagenome]